MGLSLEALCLQGRRVGMLGTRPSSWGNVGERATYAATELPRGVGTDTPGSFGFQGLRCVDGKNDRI